MTKLHSHGNAHRHALVYTDSSSTLAVRCNTAGVFILSGTCTVQRPAFRKKECEQHE